MPARRPTGARRVSLLALLAGAIAVLSVSIPAAASAEQRAYFTDVDPTSIVPGFTVGSDGTLSALAGPPATAGASGATAIVISPDASKLFVVTGDGLFAFTIDPSSGALSAAPGTPSPIGSQPYGITVAPDGGHLYVASQESGGEIYGFAIAADGSLTALAGSPFQLKAPATAPRGLAISPDGRHLYAAASPAAVRSLDVAESGVLTEQPSSPVALSAGSLPIPITITPDGRFLHVPGRSTTKFVDGLSIGPGGVPALLAGSPFAISGDGMFGATVSPDGTRFYGPDQDESMAVLSIAADGAVADVPGSPLLLAGGSGPSATALTADGSRLVVSDYGDVAHVLTPGAGLPAPITGSPFATGAKSDFQSVALTPNQPPTAALTHTVAGDGLTVDFDASATTDPDSGGARTYTWDFGDGTGAVTSSPQTTHTYAADGTYPATVAVTDAEGCSTSYISAGQTPYCNGSGRASASRSVALDAPPVFSFTYKKRQRLGKTIRIGSVSCESDCKLVGTGKIRLSGKAKRGARRSAVPERKRTTVKVRKATRRLDAGRSRPLKLKLSAKTKRISRKARKGKATIKLVASDQTGNSSKAKAKVRLR